MCDSIEALVSSLYDDEELEIVCEGDWEVDCKHQFKVDIVRYEGRTYAVQQSRQGSYHTDYYYDDNIVWRVEPKEVTKIEWVPVK